MPANREKRNETYKGKNHYLGAWAYVLLELLYCIPVIGWIVCILHCFKKDNQNLCHYARSFMVKLLLVVVVTLVSCGVAFLVLGQAQAGNRLEAIADWFAQMTRVFSGK